MENANIELQRFAKKAAAYRQALESAPNVRVLEIAPIMAILEGFVRSNELEKQKLTIVDLMSGSGYLSNFLKQAGYNNIHAIEACNEMSSNSEIYKRVTLHSISSINDVNKILKDIQPDIIVSLASFHHLIVRNADSLINYEKSINLQNQLISICVKHLGKEGIMLIADIFDDSLLSLVDTFPDNKYWSKRDFKKIIDRSFIHPDIKTKISSSTSIDKYSSLLNGFIPNLLNQQNPTINWFRNVVNKRSTIGHDDIAISQSLVEKISTKYNITADIYYCPWVFENEKQFESFLWYKFDFVNNEKTLITIDEMKTLAKNEAGINQYQDKEIYFGWALSILTIRDNSAKDVVYSKRIVLFQLIILIPFLIFYGVATKFFYYASNFWDKVIFVFIGSLLKTALDLFVIKLWKKK